MLAPLFRAALHAWILVVRARPPARRRLRRWPCARDAGPRRRHRPRDHRGRPQGPQQIFADDSNGHPDQCYCRSDHAMYARYGIPIVFFSTGSHRDYHQVSDEPQYLDYDKFARVVTYVAALTGRVADLDHRLVVDKPKPDPKAPCQQ